MPSLPPGKPQGLDLHEGLYGETKRSARNWRCNRNKDPEGRDVAAEARPRFCCPRVSTECCDATSMMRFVQCAIQAGRHALEKEGRQTQSKQAPQTCAYAAHVSPTNCASHSGATYASPDPPHNRRSPGQARTEGGGKEREAQNPQSDRAANSTV